MKLTDKQKQELDIASSRIATGKGTAIDQQNLDYAAKTYGYKYLPPAGSLDNTLPGDGGTPAEQGLPAGSVDNMTALKLALKEASNMAAKSGIKAGTQGLLGGFAEQGMSPEKVGGSLVGNIADFVSGQAVNPIQKEFSDINDVLTGIEKRQQDLQTQKDKLRDDTRSQISQAISTGMWNKMTPDQRKSLWDSAGYTGDPISSEENNTASYHTEDAQGNSWNVIYDKNTGAVVSKTNIGKIGTPSASSSTTKKDKPSAISTISSIFETPGVKGGDGKISPTDYNDAKNTWKTYYGLDPKEFDDIFGAYRNPTDTGYNIEPPRL